MSGVRSDTGPFALVPEWVLDLRLSGGAYHLYSVLSLYSDREGASFPSQKTLGERMGLSDRMVRHYRRELEEAGILKIRKRFRPDGGKSTNEYVILRVLPEGSGTLLPEGHRNDTSEQELDPTYEPDTGLETYVSNTGEGDSAQKEKTPQDLLWDALDEHVQKAPSAATARRGYAKQVREMFKAGWTPELVVRRVRAYRRHPLFGTKTLTLAALAKWGEELDRGKRTLTEGHAGNGAVHGDDGAGVPSVSVLPPEENARRMRELAGRVGLHVHKFEPWFDGVNENSICECGALGGADGYLEGLSVPSSAHPSADPTGAPGEPVHPSAGSPHPT